MEGCDLPLNSRKEFTPDGDLGFYLEMWIFGYLKIDESGNFVKIWLLNPRNKEVILFSDSHGCNQGDHHYPNVDLTKGIDDLGEFRNNEEINLKLRFGSEVTANSSQGFISGKLSSVFIEKLNSAIGWYDGINFTINDLEIGFEFDQALQDEVGGEVHYFREYVRNYFKGYQYWDGGNNMFGLPKRVFGDENLKGLVYPLS